MKKVLSVLVALTLMVGVAHAELSMSPGSRLTSNSSVQKGTLGTIGVFPALNARYVRFGEAVSNGQPVVFENANNGVLKIGSIVGRGNHIVGFSVADMDSGNFGWVAVSGISSIQSDTNEATAGTAVVCGAKQNVGACSAHEGDSNAVGIYLATDEDSATLDAILIQGLY